MTGPLEGIRVLELAGIGPAQLGAMVLGDLGAEVVRIDRPADVPLQAPATPSRELLGRGRRSLALDLKQPEAVEVAWRLIKRSDVLIDPYRPGVLERLGLGPEPVLRHNPRIVFARMTGWGQDGPLAQTAGHDLNYIALTGALAPMGAPGQPPPVPLNLVGDFGGGAMPLVIGVLAALFERERSQRGQVLDVAMIDGVATLMTSLLQLSAMGQWSEQRGANWLAGAAPWYRAYATADGRYVTVASLEEKFYTQLLARLDLDPVQWPQWDQDRWPALAERMREMFAQRTLASWCEALEGTDVCFAPVMSFAEAAAHPQLATRGVLVQRDGTWQPAPSPRFSRTPGEVGARPPWPGADTEDLLTELGYDPGESAHLLAGGSARGLPKLSQLQSGDGAADDVTESWEQASTFKREPLLVLEPLLAYFSTRGIGEGRPSISQLGDGLSNVTFLLRFADGTRLVLRRPPRGPLPPSAHDVLREAGILHRLRDTPVPVPEVLDICADTTVIGAPFYVTACLDGHVPVVSLPASLAHPRERRRYGRCLVDALAAVHAVDLHASGFDNLGAPGGYLERQIARHRALWEHNRTRELPSVDWLADWLSDNMPSERETTLVHGDFHPANVMIGPDAPARVVAVMDWELATRGDPLADVGYLCALWHERGDPENPLERGPVTRGEGSLSRAEILAHYAEVSGRSVEGHGWYEVLALWRAVIFTEGNYRRAALGGTDTPFLRQAQGHAPRLAELAMERVTMIEQPA